MSLLVGIQIAVTVILVIGIRILSLQLRHIRSKNLGFETRQMLILKTLGTGLAENRAYESFKNLLLGLPEVKGVTKSIQIPGLGATMRAVYFNEVSEEEKRVLPFIYSGHDFAGTFDLEILEGRDISRLRTADVDWVYLVNEAAVQQFGLHPVLGREITTGDRELRKGPIVGIVKNFHYGPLHENIGPLIIGLWDVPMIYISVRLKTTDISATLTKIRSLWNQFEKHRPMDYDFLDEMIHKTYRFEASLARLVGLFTFLALLTASLGILGMAMFQAENRIREIGIRRILGASLFSNLKIFWKSFFKLGFFVCFFSWPAAHFLGSAWLQSFAYRIQIHIWDFVLPTLLVWGIVLLNSGFLAWKTVRIDPVDLIRYE
jgi:putative ABC transport system permease protein